MGQHKPKSGPSTPAHSRNRMRLLFFIFTAVSLIFVLRGGITGLATSMAESAIVNRRLETAEKWLGLAKYTMGNQGQVEYLLARICRLNGDLPGMVDHLIQAHKRGLGADVLDREQVLANLSIGEVDPKSESLARNWIAELPTDVGLVVDALANGLATQSRFTEAAKLLEDYEKAFPTDPMVNYRLGIMNEHVRGNTRAEQEYSLALKKDPKFVKAAWRLARLKAVSNKPTEAIEIIEEFANGRQALAVKTFMAHCYQQAGDLEKSRELFKHVADQGHQAALQAYRAVDEYPERFLAASELGVLEVKLGSFESAKKYLEMALEVNPRDFIARNSYGQVLRRLGLNEQADKELARIVEERKEYDRITVLRDQINQNQGDTAARVEMGRILFKYESERFGVFWIRSALAYDPNCADAHQFLGEYYEQKARNATSPSDSQLFKSKSQFHFSHIKTAVPTKAADQ